MKRRRARQLTTCALRLAVVLALCFCVVAVVWAQSQSPSPTKELQSIEAANAGPALLSFDDLVALSSDAYPQGALAGRLDHLLTTPFVHNDANDALVAGLEPRRPAKWNSGPVFRAAFWNIERGLNFQQIRGALSGPAEFKRVAQFRNGLSTPQKERIEAQLRALQDADVIILNEVDFGMKRTEYRDVARELAGALHMNYAYGVEFVEVDPVFELGTQSVHLQDAQEDARLQDDLRVDRERYRGLHGNAILSRYPIRSARIFRLPVCHDWYSAEAREIAKLERTKRWTAHKLFRERTEREVRHGGRMALIADLAVPDSPTGTVTVVAAHLENKCPPGCRRRQMQALLDNLKQETNPVIFAGDLNTTSKDNTPTSVRNEIMSRVADYRFWINQAVSRFHPLGIFQYALVPVRYFHGYGDPTAFHIPIFWENRERGLFKTAEQFRFADGRAFDFRGVAGRATGGRRRTLADSNERAYKGFVSTYSFARDYGGLAGGFKLDWFFVKPLITQPRGKRQSYVFAPEFAVTMRELNQSVADRISDHPPLTVDLPFAAVAASSQN